MKRVDATDRCPKCGAPYMSMLKPGEPDNRYCFSCETAAGAAAAEANLQAASTAAVSEELELQPFEGEVEGGPRQGRMAPRGRGMRRPVVPRRPAPSARSAPVKPAGTGSQHNIPAAQKSGSVERAASAAGPSALESGAPQSAVPAPRKGSSVNIPAASKKSSVGSMPAASRSEARQKAKKPPYVSYAIMGVVVLIGAIIVYKMTRPGPAPANVAAAPADSAPRESAPVASEVRIAAKPEEQKGAKAAAQTADLPAKPAEDSPKETPAGESPTVARKPANVADLLNVNAPRKKGNAKADDDEPDVQQPAAPKTGRQDAGAPAEAPKTEPGNAQANPNPPNPPNPEGEPEKKGDAMAALGLKKTEPPPKPDDPFKPPQAIPVTAKEPTIVALDFDKIDESPDKSFTQQIAEIAPGWRAQNVKAENSAANAEHRGRKGAIGMNPINDVVPCKLTAIIEVPAKFRPRLLFEVSTRDGNHEFFLSAKAMGLQILNKMQVRVKDPPDGTKWLDIPLDLSAFAGKRFEMVLEATMRPKTKADKQKEQVCYFRNIRLDWAGKAAAPKP